MSTEPKVRALTLREYGTSGKAVGQAPKRAGQSNRIEPYWSWFGVPASVSPSRPVRFIGQAVLFGLLVAAVLDLALGAAWHVAPFAAHWFGGLPPMSSLWFDLNGALVNALNVVTLGHFNPDMAADYREQIVGYGGSARLMLGTTCLALGAAAGVWSGWRTAKPMVPNVVHIRGPRLLEGKEAWDAVRKIACRRKKGELWPKYALPIDITRGVWLPKSMWSLGTLFAGAPGAGKTTIINQITDALCHWLPVGGRFWLWDSKGEFWRRFGKRRGVALLSPFDRRSVRWSICEDITTRTDCKILAQVLAEGVSANDKFWFTAASTVIRAVLEHVAETTNRQWGFDTVAEMFSLDRQTLLATLLASGHHEVQYFIGGTGATPDSVLATVGSCVALFKNLGQAWPFDPNTPAMERFSIRNWCSDDYGKEGGPDGPRGLIIKPDDDMETVGTMLAIMVNLAGKFITGPRLADDELGRCLAFVLDELAALGGHRIDIQTLEAQGRSRGVVLLAGFQDFSQLHQIYGEQGMQGLRSMCGQHFFGKINIGETRTKLSELIGKRTVSVRPHGMGDKREAKEEQWSVVPADYMSYDLGPVEQPKSPECPNGRAVRFLLTLPTGDICALDVAAKDYPAVTDAYQQADWVSRWNKEERPDIVEIPAEEKARMMAAFEASDYAERDAQEDVAETARAAAQVPPVPPPDIPGLEGEPGRAW